MRGLEELLDLVVARSAEVAALPLDDRELALASIWGANEDAGRQAGLTTAHAQFLADSMDDWIRAALRLRISHRAPLRRVL